VTRLPAVLAKNFKVQRMEKELSDRLQPSTEYIIAECYTVLHFVSNL